MTDFQLAVHVKTTCVRRTIKVWIDDCGGLKFDTLPKAREAARKILAHRDVKYINVSKVTCVSMGRIGK